MATTDKFNGDLLAVFVNGSQIAHSTEATLEIGQDNPDCTDKQSGAFTDSIHGNRPWSISATGLVVYGATMAPETLFDFISIQQNVIVRFSTNVTGDIEYSGTASVATLNQNASQNGVTSFDVTFQGDGQLTKSSTSPEWLTNDFEVIKNPVIIPQNDANYINSLANRQSFPNAGFRVGNTAYVYFAGEGYAAGVLDEADRVFVATKDLTTGLYNDFVVNLDGSNQYDPALTGGDTAGFNDFQQYCGAIIDIGGGNYRMYYCANSDSSGVYRVGKVESTDLTAFAIPSNDQPIFSVEAAGNGGIFMFKPLQTGPTEWHALYTWNNSAILNPNIKPRLGHATSTDGLTWVVEDDDILTTTNSGLSSEPVEYNGSYYFFTSFIEPVGYGTNATGFGDFSHGCTSMRLYKTSDWEIYTEVRTAFDGIQELNYVQNPRLFPFQDINGDWIFPYLGQRYNTLRELGGTLGAEPTNFTMAAVSKTLTDSEKNGIINKVFHCYTGNGVTAREIITNTAASVVGSPIFSQFANSLKPEAAGMITFPNSIFDDVDKEYFAIKTTLNPGNIAQNNFLLGVYDDASNTNSLWYIRIDTQSIGVNIYDSTGQVKYYRTVDNFNTLKPTQPKYVDGWVDVGFIWRSGVLNICVGYNTNVNVNKLADDVFTIANGASVTNMSVGGKYSGATPTYGNTSTFIHNVAVLSGIDNATEENWLKCHVS